ncbi:type VI secretion system lipoprotein TssJ [Piscirickettsia litoralis]|uniref:Type VI secretion system-associated lipoprotein n=1 Tax=Piscirickettsia litoralis TaxID=1891921 RepID=A0ABX3A0Y5_9GAMM|nr:type VI secretion system lipoprotein TssJ [Piscirickettsia litoralis]ODN42527.1 type VI secretion system-associated lipoprotein [Piscirickettsia litoralis]
MKNHILILLFTSFIALAGCSPGLHLNFNATSNLNPDINHHPSPVVVYLYTLKQRELFDLANFQSLVNASKTLSDSLVKSYTFEIYPGQTKELSLPLSKTASYIGLFAAYRDLPVNSWKNVIDISHHPSSVTLAIKLDNNTIKVSR